MNRFIGMTAALLALPVFAPLALAESPQIAAASCLPISGPYKISANKISFKTDRIGTIVLHCELNRTELVEADTRNDILIATYRDSGGGPSTGRVQISLVGAAKGGGAKISFLQFNSNTAPAKPGVTEASGAEIPEILADFYYLARVELHRASPTQTVEIYGFSYEDSPTP